MAQKYMFSKPFDLEFYADISSAMSLQYSQIHQILTKEQTTTRIIRLKNVIIDKQHKTSHLLVSVNQHSQSKYQIISRNKQTPLQTTKGLLRSQMKSNNKQKRIDDLDKAISGRDVKNFVENSIGLTIVEDVEEEKLVYLSYVGREVDGFVFCNREGIYILAEDEAKSSNDKGVDSFIPQSIKQIRNEITKLPEQQKSELINLLSNNTMIGKHEQNTYTFFMLIHNSTGQTHSLRTIAHLFSKFNIIFNQEALSVERQYQDYEDITQEIQNEIENIQNSWALQHRIIRITSNQFIVLEFKVKNLQLVIYEEMKQSIETATQFQTYRGHFPQQLYSKVFKTYQKYYQQLKDFKVSSAAKLILYSDQMLIPLQKILLQAQACSKISKMQYQQFQDCSLNTFVIYLFVAPEGTNRSNIINTLKQKVRVMNSSSLSIQYTNPQKLLWNNAIVKKFAENDSIFQQSKYSFIFMNLGFHSDIPNLVFETFRDTIPQKYNYKILHIMPQCQTPFQFSTEMSSQPTIYPFDVNLLLFSLKSLEKRNEEYTKELTPIENLSKLVHLLSFNFKNYKEQVHEGSRLRLIKVDYGIKLSQIPHNVIVSLEELLDFSYQKQYTESQYILHYFLEALQNLEIVSEPEVESIAQKILMYSFWKLSYISMV